jgi:hypothetical protein
MIVACAALGVAWWAISELPPHIVQHDEIVPDDRSSALASTRAATIAGLAGVVAAIGAVFTGLAYRAGTRRNFDDRYAKGAEMLAHEQLSVRLGGVYLLADLGAVSAGHHVSIMRVLETFAYEESLRMDGEIARKGMGVYQENPRQFRGVAAAARAIGNRRRHLDPATFELVLDGITAPDANFKGCDFRGVSLRKARLPGAILRGARLSEVNLQETTLTGADLTSADLSKAQLEGARLNSADVKNADFSGITFDAYTEVPRMLHLSEAVGVDLQTQPWRGPGPSG